MSHTGSVEFFNVDKGYGIIAGDDGDKYFVHFSKIVADGFKSLGDGEQVEFGVETNPNNGKLEAVNVTGPGGSPVQGSDRKGKGGGKGGGKKGGSFNGGGPRYNGGGGGGFAGRSGDMMRGAVKFFNADKGYGFIGGDDGNDYFVHFSQIHADGFKSLGNGEEVEFEVETESSGKLKAINVTGPGGSPVLGDQGGGKKGGGKGGGKKGGGKKGGFDGGFGGGYGGGGGGFGGGFG